MTAAVICSACGWRAVRPGGGICRDCCEASGPHDNVGQPARCADCWTPQDEQ